MTRRAARGHTVLTVMLVLLALAAAWHFGPLAQWLTVPALATAGERIAALPFAPAVVIGIYLVAGFVVLPVNILIAATVLVFGPWQGSMYALCGIAASAAVTYAIAARCGSRLPRAARAGRLEPLRAYIAKRGWPAVFVVRVLPIAPFTVINTIAGVWHIPWRAFIVGTVLGMVPGIAGIAFFADRLIDAISNPTPLRFAVVAASAAVVCVLVLLARRFAARHSR